MARALGSVFLVACCCSWTVAEESRVRWWPFGDKSEASAANENSTPEATSTTQATTSQVGAAPSAITTAPSATAPTTSTVIPQGQSAPSDYPSEELPERRWMFQSPMKRVSWPRIHMPEMPKPSLPRPQLWPEKSEVDEARNAWVQPGPEPSRPSPLQSVKQGANRVGESTRSAWRKTVDVLTPGGSSNSESSRIARRETRPPFWKRMFTVEEPEPQGPRTVTEWMAQDRLDP